MLLSTLTTIINLSLLFLTTHILALPSSPIPLSAALPRRSTADASSTDFTCESQVPQITSCNSKTSAYSCYLATQAACAQAAADTTHQDFGHKNINGTCTAIVYLNSADSLSFDDCTAAFQRINDGCVSPGERADPGDNEPTMRGWQNADPGNLDKATYTGCGNPVDKMVPSYELASNNCVGKWGTGCGGQNRPYKAAPTDGAPITANPPLGWPWAYWGGV
ncbi:MAG: hypothetical protein OHK93_004999 [Ramalina farinacea]|uniref:Uncharacterized protein n=1 Tax=Ramalina farinacea TaxID=258253 RepID=A0AA43QXI7_9LECA|nr:hypothetical protein [Ramalina farinacea]